MKLVRKIACGLLMIGIIIFGGIFALNAYALGDLDEGDSYAIFADQGILDGLSVSYVDDYASTDRVTATIQENTNARSVQITLGVQPMRATAVTATLSISNNSGKTVVLTYGISETSLDDANGVASSNVTLADGESFSELTFVAPSGNTTTKTFYVSISFSWEIESVDGSIFMPALGRGEIGFKNADGTVPEISSAGYTVVKLDAAGKLTYQATPANGWVFFGFRIEKDSNVANDAYVSYVSTFSVNSSGAIITANADAVFSGDVTATPVFIPADAAVFYAGNAYFPFLDEALDSDITGATVKVHTNGIAYSSALLTDGNTYLPQVFTIPSGKTLWIPYGAGDVGNVDDNVGSASQTMGAVYRQLTIRKNDILNVEGTLLVNSKQSRVNTSNQGNIGGTYAHLDLQGRMVVTGTLYARGIIGGEADSEIVVKSGATVYQLMEITDWCGGSNAMKLSTNKVLSGKSIFPVAQFYMQNIQVLAIYEYGCFAKAQYFAYANSEAFTGEATVLASDKSGLFQLNSGYVAMGYINTTDCPAKTVVEVHGEVEVLSINMNIYVSVSSENFICPISAAFDIVVFENGNLIIAKHFKILPGVTIEVQEKGALTIKNDGALYLYGGYSYNDHVFGNYRKLPLTAKKGSVVHAEGKAVLLINGTLTIESGGKLYCLQSDGTSVTTTKNTGKIVIKSQSSWKSGALYEPNYSSSDSLQGTGGIFGIGADYSKTVNFTVAKAHLASCTGCLSGNCVWSELSANTTYYSDGSKWGTHKTVYQSSSATDAEVVDVHVAMGGYSTAAAPGLSQAEWYDGTYRYKGAGTWTQNSEANNCRIFVPSSKTKVGFTTYADSTRGDKCTITEEYRLNDYIWLNASFYLNSTLSPSNLQATVETVGSENDAQLVVVGEQVYIVMKVYSDDLANEWELTLTYNENGTLLTETIVLSLEDYRQKLGKSHKHYYLLGAMIDYGTASDEYFNVNGTVSSAQKFEVWGPENYREKQFDARNQYNGVQLKTTGATVYFNNCLALAMQFRTNGTVTLQNGDRIVQIGLLAGTSSQYIEGQEQLLTDDHAYDQAFILYGAYGSQNGTDDKPGKPSGQASSGSNGVLSECPTISNSMMISFDLTNDQYLQRYALRPFIVIEHANGTYLNLYGEQYLYGLESYCASVNANSTNNDSKNLAYYAWNYAQIAANVAY